MTSKAKNKKNPCNRIVAGQVFKRDRLTDFAQAEITKDWIWATELIATVIVISYSYHAGSLCVGSLEMANKNKSITNIQNIRQWMKDSQIEMVSFELRTKRSKWLSKTNIFGTTMQSSLCFEYNSFLSCISIAGITSFGVQKLFDWICWTAKVNNI